ncbi:MAG: hypothetical protein A3F13_08685 [Gammaproteobacteria bacterium RIFCSPHIGHO2_12_FULL_40_19]|nr:MAG: hypothetical protein A3F13_08685 [Gammaproteobacteria bacterium RIFCSPHIGHO2_12_FULL_40_19]
MRETGRMFKLVGETLLGEENAPLRYRQGCERDALDASETEERSNLMEIEAAATNKLIEAYHINWCSHIKTESKERPEHAKAQMRMQSRWLNPAREWKIEIIKNYSKYFMMDVNTFW